VIEVTSWAGGVAQLVECLPSKREIPEFKLQKKCVRCANAVTHGGPG
jgi:hypothetical protein